MTEPAKAVLFIQQSNGRVSADDFYVRADSDVDPFHQAKGLWGTVKDDFPGAVHAIYMNDAARKLAGDTRMRAMGFEDQV